MDFTNTFYIHWDRLFIYFFFILYLFIYLFIYLFSIYLPICYLFKQITWLERLHYGYSFL